MPKSKGHLWISDGWEFFNKEGYICRALFDAKLDKDGYKMGAKQHHPSTESNLEYMRAVFPPNWSPKIGDKVVLLLNQVSNFSMLDSRLFYSSAEVLEVKENRVGIKFEFSPTVFWFNSNVLKLVNE